MSINRPALVKPLMKQPTATYRLLPEQHRILNAAANTLPPERRHSFLLRCSRILQMSVQDNGFVSFALISRAIDVARTEVEAMR